MNRIVEFARQQVGKPYKLGRHGPDLWDCSGLTMEAVKQVGLRWKHGATSQWKEGFTKGYWERYGFIDTMPTDVLVFLFNQDMSKPTLTMGHTGMRDGFGNGNVIQAGGQYSGVSDKPFARKRWSHWATITGTGGGSVVYRIGSSGKDVVEIQTNLMRIGFSLPRFGADGKYGAETEQAVKGFQRNNNLDPTGEVNEELFIMLGKGAPVDINAYAVELVQIAQRLTEISTELIRLTR